RAGWRSRGGGCGGGKKGSEGTAKKCRARPARPAVSTYTLAGQSHFPPSWWVRSMQGRVFLGRYETIRLLGEGGMGRGYLARHVDRGRQVVIKVMHDHVAADATFRERFQRETLLMARFQHPYAVTLYDAKLDVVDQDGCGGPFIVMEYIKGATLDVLLHKNA